MALPCEQFQCGTVDFRKSGHAVNLTAACCRSAQAAASSTFDERTRLLASVVQEYRRLPRIARSAITLNINISNLGALGCPARYAQLALLPPEQSRFEGCARCCEG